MILNKLHKKRFCIKNPGFNEGVSFDIKKINKNNEPMTFKSQKVSIESDKLKGYRKLLIFYLKFKCPLTATFRTRRYFWQRVSKSTQQRFTISRQIYSNNLLSFKDKLIIDIKKEVESTQQFQINIYVLCTLYVLLD